MTEPLLRAGYSQPAKGQTLPVTQEEENEGPMKWSLTEFLRMRDASLICTTSEMALQTYADLLQNWHQRIGAELKRLYPEEKDANQDTGVVGQV